MGLMGVCRCIRRHRLKISTNWPHCCRFLLWLAQSTGNAVDGTIVSSNVMGCSGTFQGSREWTWLSCILACLMATCVENIPCTSLDASKKNGTVSSLFLWQPCASASLLGWNRGYCSGQGLACNNLMQLVPGPWNGAKSLCAIVSIIGIQMEVC